jgi:hypothetical protein
LKSWKSGIKGFEDRESKDDQHPDETVPIWIYHPDWGKSTHYQQY